MNVRSTFIALKNLLPILLFYEQARYEKKAKAQKTYGE